MSGLVKYRHRDASTFRRLRQPTKIPFGSEVDTRGGRVRLTVRRTADAPRESAIFYGGRFRIRQDPRVTTLRIRGGSFAETCPEDDVATTSRRRRRSVRHLWGSGRGRFRTRGRYSAATVRGTTWLVEDLCDGTRTVVERGEVEVEDFTVPDTPPDSDRGPEGGGDEGAVAPQAMGAPSKPRRVRVRRGGSYVAGPGR